MSKKPELYNLTEITDRLRDSATCRSTFNEVIKIFSEPLYWQIRKIVINHDDTNDLLQNTFLKAWSSIENFRGDAKLSTWLHKIAINESITFINKQKAKLQIPLDESNEFLLDNIQGSEWFDGDEIQLKLQQAISRLPEKQRLVFNMRYFDEMKYEEISEILSTSEGALKASYHHAVKKIEDFFFNND
ncbi:MAG: RNA polymerase sigma factor [Bacteroidales bacterium]